MKDVLFPLRKGTPGQITIDKAQHCHIWLQRETFLTLAKDSYFLRFLSPTGARPNALSQQPLCIHALTTDD